MSEHSQHIASLNWKSAVTVFVIVIAPVLLTALFLSPIAGRKIIAVALLVGVLVVPVGLILFWQLFNVKASWDGRSLRVGGGLYSVEVPARELRLEDASLINGARPTWRTNGIGMPGLRLGWFRHAGRRVFLAVTKQDCVYVPGANFDVIFSPDDPAAFLASLQNTGT
jgi:hypothetical protein